MSTDLITYDDRAEKNGALTRQESRMAAYVPKNFDDLVQYATFISKSDLVPKEMRGKPADVLLAMQLGGELGMPAAQALQSIAVINGRPSIWGDGMLAVVRKSGLLEDFKESMELDDDGLPLRAITVAKRKGDPNVYIGEFTQADAIRAGLWGKNTWLAYPKDLMKFKGRARCLRDGFGDVLKGLQSAEDMMDIEEEGEYSFTNSSAVDEALQSRLETAPPVPPKRARAADPDAKPALRADGCTCGAPAGKPHLKPCPLAAQTMQTSEGPIGVTVTPDIDKSEPLGSVKDEIAKAYEAFGIPHDGKHEIHLIDALNRVRGWDYDTLADFDAKMLYEARKLHEAEKAHPTLAV